MDENARIEKGRETSRGDDHICDETTVVEDDSTVKPRSNNEDPELIYEHSKIQRRIHTEVEGGCGCHLIFSHPKASRTRHALPDQAIHLHVYCAQRTAICEPPLQCKSLTGPF